jgi:hypothetical protein
MASRSMKGRVTATSVLVAGAGFACGRVLARRLARSSERGPASLHGMVVLITGASRGLALRWLKSLEAEAQRSC